MFLKPNVRPQPFTAKVREELGLSSFSPVHLSLGAEAGTLNAMSGKPLRLVAMPTHCIRTQ